MDPLDETITLDTIASATSTVCPACHSAPLHPCKSRSLTPLLSTYVHMSRLLAALPSHNPHSPASLPHSALFAPPPPDLLPRTA